MTPAETQFAAWSVRWTMAPGWAVRFRHRRPRAPRGLSLLTQRGLLGAPASPPLSELQDACSDLIGSQASLTPGLEGMMALKSPSCCCCSVTESCPALCDPVDHSTPGSLVLHFPPGFAQTHVHRVSDAIQPSHPRSPPSPFAFNLSQHQSLFQ